MSTLPGQIQRAFFSCHTDNIGGFDKYPNIPIRPKSLLEGNTIFDDSNQGQLFGTSDSPRLIKLGPSVAWARVGSEGSDWTGINFRPTESSLGDILGGRQGRFFLRIYDGKRDGCDFRYLPKLTEIHINDEPYTSSTILTPSAKGHTPTRVCFIGLDGTKITPSEITNARREKDHLVVDPHPDHDGISCKFISGSGTVNVVICPPWIWWRMEQNGCEPRSWCDRHLAMTRQAFCELANTSLRLRVPRWLDFVHVGFDDKVDRKYPSRRQPSFSSVVVPLEDFIDYPQIDRKPGGEAFLIAKCHQTYVPLIRIDRDCVLTDTNDLRKRPNPIGNKKDWPRAIIRCSNGQWRYGRGFSLGEVREAGLTPTNPKSLSLRVDKRRRTTHADNVTTIRRGVIDA